VLLGVIKISRPVRRTIPLSGIGQTIFVGETPSAATQGAMMLDNSHSRNGFGLQPRSSDVGCTVAEESAGVPGIRSIIADAATMIHNAIYFFVLKTSLLQSVESDSRTNILDIEMSNSQYLPIHLPLRTISGDLDGGNEDF
jgi:hypothetical protein